MGTAGALSETLFGRTRGAVLSVLYGHIGVKRAFVVNSPRESEKMPRIGFGKTTPTRSPEQVRNKGIARTGSPLLMPVVLSASRIGIGH
jgi:hypothetical protein